MQHRLPAATRLAILAAASAAALLAGCYKKTVSASGFGADRMTIEPSENDKRVLGYPTTRYKSLPTTH